MTVVERRVRALRVRAPDGDRARRAAIVLEDALRTASLPGASEGRLVVIRSLDLGRVPLGASPATVSLAVEGAVQRLASGAVHGESASASSASAVYFHDDSDAILTLARRVASGNSAAGWFWPLVVRGWSPMLSPAQTMSLLIDRALDTAAGAVSVAQLVALLVEMGAADLVLAPLSERRGAALLAATGWSEIDNDASPAARVAARLKPQAERTVARWIAQWPRGVADPRAKWLAAMLLVADVPPRATSKALVATVRDVLSSIAQSGRERTVAVDSRDGETHWERPAGPRAERGEMMSPEPKRWRLPERQALSSDLGGGPPRPNMCSAPPPPLQNESAPALPPSSPDTTEPGRTPDETFEPAPHDPFWGTPQPTSYAGLLFLIPILSRIGIATLLAEQPELLERQWPERLLLRLARRLGVPPDDAVLAWLAPPDDAIADVDRPITAAWLRASRDRALRDTTRTLGAIVRRRGAIVVTRTHIDVLFRHSHADVAVRRAGLDIDPGWVFWLGRVIRFHYLDVLPDDVA